MRMGVGCDFWTAPASGGCRKDWHSAAIGAVLSVRLGRQGRSEILPCRLYRRCGASVVRRDAVFNRMEDLSVQVCKEAISCKITIVCEGSKTLPTAR
jgi:hypothetical protein